MQQWLSLPSAKGLSLAELRHWFADDAGAALLAAGNVLLEERLAACFGSYLLEYNPLGAVSQASAVRQQIRLGEGSAGHELQCLEGYWPVQPGSLDAVVLRHSLEFARSPHDLLRQAVQALRPGGHLLITGLNPYSWQGLLSYRRRSPWRKGRRLTAARLAEWLAVLGLACEPVRFARLPHGEPSGQSAWHPAHGCYLLVARRQMHGLSQRRPKQRVLPGLIARPVVRESKPSGLIKQQDQHD